ncbi:MAG: YegP family protein [Xanthomonadaceae bacterium]|nr:YegP family protein [Xanthomonadaceae bacterium]
MAGKFEIKVGSNGEHYFSLKAGNGLVILGSEGYRARASCLNGIESVRKHCAVDGNFERKTAKNGKNYFTLNASNGQVIGKSQMYASAASCEKGIASVKANAPTAPIAES